MECTFQSIYRIVPFVTSQPSGAPISFMDIKLAKREKRQVVSTCEFNLSPTGFHFFQSEDCLVPTAVSVSIFVLGLHPVVFFLCDTMDGQTKTSSFHRTMHQNNVIQFLDWVTQALSHTKNTIRTEEAQSPVPLSQIKKLCVLLNKQNMSRKIT